MDWLTRTISTLCFISPHASRSIGTTRRSIRGGGDPSDQFRLNNHESFFEKHEADDHFDNDELVVRLVDLRESLRNEYSVGQTLNEQLADAVEQEKYELAARLRDELSRRDMK